VRVHYKDTSADTPESYVTVWTVFLISLMHNYLQQVAYYPNSPHKHQLWEVAELLLKYGGYGNSFFLLAHSENPSVPVYVISLQELIRQWKPRNQEALLQLIDKDVPSNFRSRLKKWRITRRRSSGTPFDPAQYKPFHLGMRGTSEDDGKDMYYLYSVWSAGYETKAQGLTVRIL
jgi:hypothetical protein